MFALAAQPDGKWVLGGNFSTLAGQSRLHIGRLNADDTLDAGFNPGVDMLLFAVAAQADGKILTGGQFSALGGQTRNNIGRLNTDGTLDTGFNPGANDVVYSIAIQADGKILVGGRFTTLGGQPRNYLGRLNANGTLDSGFTVGANNHVYSLAVQADGKILVGGSFTTLDGQTRNRIARLNPDGTVDGGFNPGADNGVASLVVQADGKIVAGGLFTTLGGQARNRIARLNADGTLESGFSPGADNWVSSMAIQSDGKILVGGGFTVLGGQSRNCIGRLNATEPATEHLSFNGSTITWLRGGTSPEVWRTTFEQSTNGTAWTSLGGGTRVAGGWELTGTSLPVGATIRARGHATGGQYNGSSWFVESQIQNTNTFFTPPSIAQQPQSQTNAVGTTATFSVAAGGTEPLSFQWRFNGTNLPGAVSTNLTLPTVQAADAGNYTVVITNAAGAVTSSVAVLTVWVPPTITTQPQSRTNISGTIANFSVTAAGTPPFSYQWRFGGTNLAAQTNAALVLVNVQPANAGNYDVVVTNVAGSLTSLVASLTVWIPPTITSQPQSQTNITGTTANFSVTASGTAPLNYQWRLGGTSLASQTNAPLALANVQPVNAGNYDLVVTNVAGSVTSQVAVLTIWVAPTITIQPQSQTNIAGTTANFSVTASGTSPLSYQWRFGGTNLAAQTNSALALPNVQLSNAGIYDVVVTNVAGSVTSAVAVLTVTSASVAPQITTQPLTQVVLVGAPMNFSVTASGTPVPAYQWRKDGVPLSGATNATYPIASAQTNDAGSYSVVVSNTAGSQVSAPATLSVLPPGWQTADIGNVGALGWAAGSQTGFRVAGAGEDIFTEADAFRFVWMPVTNNVSVVAQVLGMDATHTYAKAGVMIREDLGAGARHAMMMLTPSNGTQLIWRTATGSRAGVALAGDGIKPPYWLKLDRSGSSFTASKSADGVTWTTWLTTNVTMGANVYAGLAVASHDTNLLCKAGFSSVDIPGYYQAPRIVLQPTSRILSVGTNIILVVSATGTPNPSYQWRLNGVALSDGGRFSGAATSNLVISSVQTNDGGSYTVVVSNTLGSVTSASAVVAVQVPPSITTQPASQVAAVGTNASFSVAASGTAPLDYQWRFNGTNLAGATSTNLTIANVQPANGGNYSVVVANLAGSVTSAVATLTVNVPLSISLQPQSQTVLAGTNVTFTVSASGTPAPWYQWRKDGTPLSGATNATYSITGVQTNHVGTYTVLVTNTAGNRLSGEATLSVLPPGWRNLDVGSIGAAGWSGGNLSAFRVAGAGADIYTAADGFHFVYVPVTGDVSIVARVMDLDATHTYAKAGVMIREDITSGARHAMMMLTPSNGTQLIWRAIPNSASQAIVGIDTLRSPYWIKLVRNGSTFTTSKSSDGVTWVNSVSATVSMGATAYAGLAVTSHDTNVLCRATFAGVEIPGYYQAPRIADQPPNMTVPTGTNVSLTVAATGAPSLGFQWLFNGLNLTGGARFSGVTTSNLVISGTQSNDMGSYTVFITNVAGAVTSSVATLTVLTPPLILQAPTNQTVECSGNATFTVVAGGDMPLSYQWSVSVISNQWAVISGATNTSLTLSNAHGAQAGLYSVVVSNASGSATSAPVALTVEDTTPPVILYSFTNLTLIAGASGQALMPDVTGTNYFRAVDSCSTLTVMQSIATNTPLALGTRPVVLTALDASGNAAWSTNGVTVVDLTPPTVTCPTNRVLNTDPGTASRSNVSFTATATDNVTVTNVACVPPSGSTFPIGTNVVICTARDSSGNSNSCSFTVEVTSVLSASVAETVNTRIPDGSPVGLVSSLNVDSVIERVTNVTVLLVVTGGFNGDLHAYLVHDSGHAILLNRAGKTLANPSGYSDAGFNVTFDDGATNGDIHNYRVALSGNPNTPLAGPLTGPWAPDGRDTDPALVLDTDSRSTTLSAFTGLNPNGRWTLFVADVDALYASTLVSWGLEIRGTNALPVITAPPQSRTNVLTTEAVFSVAASGLSAVSYQWQKSVVRGQWSEISGATNATLHIPNVQSNDAGSYAVRVTTLGGSVMSEPATLTVIDQTVNGAVQMEFYAGLAGDGAGNRTVALKGTDATNGPLATWNLPLNFTNSTASFTLAHAPLGLAHLSAKTAWHLRKRLGVTFTNGLATVNFTGTDQLAAGDMDGSNVVNLGDYFILAGTWYTPNAAADLDGSGWVDWEDYFLMAEHWLQAGDAP